MQSKTVITDLEVKVEYFFDREGKKQFDEIDTYHGYRLKLYPTDPNFRLQNHGVKIIFPSTSWLTGKQEFVSPKVHEIWLIKVIKEGAFGIGYPIKKLGKLSRKGNKKF